MSRTSFSRLAFSALLCGSLLSGCAKNMNSTTYSDNATPGKVLEGTIISARAVTIKSHDKLQDNTLGGLGGGVAGGLAGSQIGNGAGSVGAGIGGALVGAVAGALIQDALSTSDGMEYLVKLDSKYIEPMERKKKIISKGSISAEDDMKSSIATDTRSDIVSVVQAPDQAVHVGSHVYVIYNDDRPRIVPAQQ